jgi:hypothetical protein
MTKLSRYIFDLYDCICICIRIRLCVYAISLLACCMQYIPPCTRIHTCTHLSIIIYPYIMLQTYIQTGRQTSRQAYRHTQIHGEFFLLGHLRVQQSFVNIVILYSAFWVPVVRMENSPGPADYVVQPGSPADKRGKRVRPQGIFLQSLPNHMCKTGHCCDPTMFFHISYLQKIAD